MNELSIFEPGDGRVLALLNNDTSGIGAALGGGLAGGINRLSIKGNRFRFYRGGTEVYVHPDRELEVVIIGANPGVSRIWFKNPYGQVEGQRPTCWSHDGVAPEAPPEQIPQVQTSAGWRPVNSCAECPNNVKGSGQNGGRACQFKKRVVVVSPDDIDGDAYAFDINAMSLFGDSDPANGERSLKDYVAYLCAPRPGFQRGIPPHAIITRMTFNVNESVPVVRFGVALNSERRAAFLGPDQITAVVERTHDADVQALLKVDEEDYANSAPVAQNDAVYDVQTPLPGTTAGEDAGTAAGQDTAQDEAPGLMHPDVPGDMREWARHPAVTGDMVFDYLRENYPQALEAPEPKTPPPPPPRSGAAPPAPPTATAGASAGRRGSARRKAAAGETPAEAPPPASRAPGAAKRARGFVPPSQAQARPTQGQARAEPARDDADDPEAGLGGELATKMAALLAGVDD
jgi:hypothetical protein